MGKISNKTKMANECKSGGNNSTKKNKEDEGVGRGALGLSIGWSGKALLGKSSHRKDLKIIGRQLQRYRVKES